MAVSTRGIYGIHHEDHGIYVGMSEDCERREPEHDRLLRSGRHHCQELQTVCFGIDGREWRFIMLEEVPVNVRLATREYYWRENIRDCLNPPGYNPRDADWGYFFFNYCVDRLNARKAKLTEWIHVLADGTRIWMWGPPKTKSAKPAGRQLRRRRTRAHTRVRRRESRDGAGQRVR